MPSTQTKIDRAEQAAVLHNPELTMRQKYEILGLRGAKDMKALRAELEDLQLPAIPGPEERAVTDSAYGSFNWNPARNSQFQSFRDTLYGYQTATIKGVCKLCWDLAGPKGLPSLQSGIRLQAQMAATGFTHVTEKDNRVKTYYDAFADLWGMRTQLLGVFETSIGFDNAIITWRKPKDNIYGPDFLEFEVRNPKDVRVEYTGTTSDVTDDGNLVYLEINEVHRQMMLDFMRSKVAEERGVALAFARENPRMWQVYNDRKLPTEYLLSNAEGEFWAIINLRNRGRGLDDPTMQTIFRDIDIIGSLRDGDMVIASLIKRVIGLVTMGETLNQNQVVPAEWHSQIGVPNPGWARNKDFSKLKAALGSRAGVLLYLFAPHNTEIDYKFPDPKILENGKYVTSLDNIMTWLVMGAPFLNGEGGQFQSAEINKIGLTARLNTLRDLCTEEFVRKVYRHPTININRYGDVPGISFDRDVLKSPKDIREDNKLAVMLGRSQRTALEKCGDDFEREMERRRAERKEYKDLLKNQVPLTGNIPAPPKPVAPKQQPGTGITPDGNPGAGRPADTTVEQPSPARRDDEL